ncbi:AI-2E family transporter [Dehalobacter sp. DCM]|uniref:AI-2E family transporter n=1 Tax=Dehalobacter sp. DCM TaxID=2907827 RepID=UPI0030817EC6|nr:AI-2E family transporter [Dehalobacter sp. DCM]
MLQNKLRWIFGILLAALTIIILLKVKKITLTFAAGAIIAYLLCPVVSWLTNKGIKRKWAVAITFILILITLTLLFLLLLPTFYQELGRLAVVMPNRLEVINHYVKSLQSAYPQFNISQEITMLMEKKMDQMQYYIIDWMGKTIENLPELLSSIGLMVLSPILALYFLIDWPKITDGVIKIVPGRMRAGWHKLLMEIDFVIKRYFQVNILDAVIVGVLIGFGITLIGMDYALIIGIICGITNIIPYFGPILGAVPSILLALSRSPLLALKVALIIFIVQQIDSNFINPRLMGNKIGMHPLWIVFVLLVGGELGGLFGMLVAVPFAAVIRIIIRHLYYLLVAPRELKLNKNE